MRLMRALAATLALPSAALWLLIGYLGLIEVEDAFTNAETEHSPLLVLLMVLPVASALTAAAWWTWRRSSRG